MKSLLAPSLAIKPSQLLVKNLEVVAKFYKDIVGLQVLEQTPSRIVLGHDTVPALELVAKPEFRIANVTSAGLFHNAIVFNSRAALAATVLNIIQKAPWAYEGSADHLVSEAFYFHDPENNGLELYFDRPRESWKWNDGSVAMDTLYLSPEAYLAQYLDGENDPGKKIGHVHLRVGDVPTAKRFYVDQLGFDITFAMDSALFVSVGGYHHHMAMNTWFSKGASKRDPALGLGEVKLHVPRDGSLERLAKRLDSQHIPFTLNQRGLHVSDPWENKLLLKED